VRRKYWIGGGLALVTLALFWQLTSCEFINFDDQIYVTSNADVRAGLTGHGTAWAFKTFAAGNWHPVTWISHMLDCQVYGLRAGGHHFTNVLLHTANTVLLFGLLLRMTGAIWRSALVAALFAWHPLHVESVAWVSERKDVLSAFFGLLALIGHVRYTQSPKSKLQSPKSGNGKVFYGLAVMFFGLGLMSKPMLVTLPFVMLLLDWWPLNRTASVGRLLWEKTPFFLLSLASCAVTFVAQHAGGAMASLENLAPERRAANGLVSYAGYLRKAFWPDDLAMCYPIPLSVSDWEVSVAVLLFGALTLGAIALRRCRYVAVGWLWFVGMLVPVIGLVQVGSQGMADRYTYLPLIGIFVAIVWGLADVAARWPASRMFLQGGIVAVLCACMVLTWNQARTWRDSISVFSHAVAVTENNYQAHDVLGLALLEAGKTDEALEHFSAVVQIWPNSPVGHFHAGCALEQKGRLEEARAEFEAALKGRPGMAEAHLELGRLLSGQGKADEALAQFEAGRQLRPDDPDAASGMGMALSAQGRTREAIANYRAALRLNPDAPEALNNLAWILATDPDAANRDGADAVRLAQRACDLTHFEEPLFVGTLAAAEAEAGRFDEAAEMGQKAYQLFLASGNKDMAETNKTLLELYRSQRPYHEEPRRGGSKVSLDGEPPK
jgi:Flp pilus assembly protein TadD